MTGTVVFGCEDLSSTSAFFVGLGFRVDQIAPADDPASMLLSGHGLQMRLDRNVAEKKGRLDLVGEGPSVVAPNGVEVRYVADGRPLILPETVPGRVVSRLESDDSWAEGRAAMLYRDLIPGRFGGAFIASHIKIPLGGPVPDSVHYHQVAFQLLYCYRGWVRVVYQDQGEPFVMHAGDAVLQPPEIRHRVLESSDAFEIIELGCPAVHDTFFDHDLALPTQNIDVTRTFNGQTFVRHVATEAPVSEAPTSSRRDLGIFAGTGGLVEASVARLAPGAELPSLGRPDFSFRFVLEGELNLTPREAAATDELRAGDAMSSAHREVEAATAGTRGCEVLEVVVPDVCSIEGTRLVNPA